VKSYPRANVKRDGVACSRHGASDPSKPLNRAPFLCRFTTTLDVWKRPLPSGRALAYIAWHAARRVLGEPGPFSASKTSDWSRLPMLITRTGNPSVQLALNAPAIAVVYAGIAYGFVTIGCIPAFSDVDFFGVRVTLFLLAALTVAALILIVLACLHAMRVLRAIRLRHRGVERPQDRGLRVAVVAIALAAFAGTVWMGSIFLWAPC